MKGVFSTKRCVFDIFVDFLLNRINELFYVLIDNQTNYNR